MSEDLTACPLRRNGSVRGQLIEAVEVRLVTHDYTAGSQVHETDDQVFWDDLRATVSRRGQPNTAAAELVANGMGATAGRGPFLTLIPSTGPDAGRLDLRWSGPPRAPLVLFCGTPAPGAMRLGCLGTLDIAAPTLTTLFDGFTTPQTLFFRLDGAGRSTQTLYLPLPMASGTRLMLQGLVVQPSGCRALMTAGMELYLAQR